MTNLIIRKAEKADAPVIRDLTAELAEHEKFEGFNVPVSYYEDNFFGPDSYADIYMMQAQGQAIGMGHVMKLASTYRGGHELLLRDFVIQKAHRNKGYGREFLKFICSLAFDMDCQKVLWFAYDWNKEALGLYQKLSHIETDVVACVIDQQRIEEIVRI